MSAAIVCGALLHLFAAHQAAGMNNTTPGLGLECQNGDAVAAVGVYRNSINQTSAYVVGGSMPVHLGAVRLGGVTGIVTGYELNHGGPIPMAAAVVEWDAGTVEVELFAVPAVAGVSHAAVQLGVVIPFGGSDAK